MALRFLLVINLVLLASCRDMDSDVEVEGFPPSDVEMNRAYRTSRREVGGFLKALEHPSSDARYLVKMRVEADGKMEHMWIESISYRNGVFYGELGNKPARITSIQKGAKLQVNEAEISDWAIVDRAGGIVAGGYTIQVMAEKEGVRPS